MMMYNDSMHTINQQAKKKNKFIIGYNAKIEKYSYNCT